MPKYAALLPFAAALDQFMNDEARQAEILRQQKQQAFENRLAVNELDIKQANQRLSEEMFRTATLPKTQEEVAGMRQERTFSAQDRAKLEENLRKVGEILKARGITKIPVDQLDIYLNAINTMGGIETGEASLREGVPRLTVEADIAAKKLAKTQATEEEKVTPRLVEAKTKKLEGEAEVQGFEGEKAKALRQQQYAQTAAEIMVALLKKKPELMDAEIGLLRARATGELMGKGKADELALRRQAEKMGIDWDEHLMREHMVKVATPIVQDIRLASSALSNIKAGTPSALQQAMASLPNISWGAIQPTESGKKEAEKLLEDFIKTQKALLTYVTKGMIDYDELLAEYEKRTAPAPPPELYDQAGGADLNDLLPEIDKILEKGKK